MNLVELARESVRFYLEKRKLMPLPSNLPPYLKEKRAGVFVTLKKDGRLRGCIGTYLPTKRCIAEEVIDNAVAAAFFDPRFPPLEKEEFKDTKFEVSILGELERVSSLDELDPQKYGVLVKSADGRSGLLLPDIEGVDSVEKQVFIACQKAGIDLKEGKDQISIFRFRVSKYEEEK